MSLQTEGIELDALVSDPASPPDGRIWFNTTDGKLKIRIEGVTRVQDVFGSEYVLDEDLPESTETGNVYVQQHRYTTPVLPAGNYRVAWSAEFKGTNIGRAVGLRIQQDDLTDLFLNEEVLSISYRNFGAFYNLALDGVHTFDFDIRRVSAQAVTATIRNIRIEIWRTS